MGPIEIMLKEYETLRQEILTAMSSRNSILSFGLATIGAIFTAGIAAYTADTYSLLSSLMLMLAVPAISTFVLFIWLGEYQRMQRAGKFLVDIERRINEEASKELLTWETHLRAQRRHMKYPYNTTVMLLTVISVISLAIGLVTIELSISIKLILAVAGIISLIWVCMYVASSMSKLRL